MLRLIRLIITICVLGLLAYCGATVELGNKTFFGHIQSIWKAEETRDLVDGVKEKSGPVIDKVRRGVKAGVEEATSDEPSTDDGQGSGEQPAAEENP